MKNSIFQFNSRQYVIIIYSYPLVKTFIQFVQLSISKTFIQFVLFLSIYLSTV